MATPEYDKMVSEVTDYITEFGSLVSGGDSSIEDDVIVDELARAVLNVVNRVMQYARQHERAH